MSSNVHLEIRKQLMCSLVGILPKVGHVELEEIQRLWEERGVLLHVSFIIYDELNGCESNESDVFSDASLVHDGLGNHQGNGLSHDAGNLRPPSAKNDGSCDGFVTAEVTPGTIVARRSWQGFAHTWRSHAKNLGLQRDRTVAGSWLHRQSWKKCLAFERLGFLTSPHPAHPPPPKKK